MSPKPRTCLLVSTLLNDNSSLGRIGQNWIDYFSRNENFDLCLDLWRESSQPSAQVLGIARASRGKTYQATLRKSDPYSAWNVARQGAKNFAYIYYDAVSIEPWVIRNINEKLTGLVVPSEFTKDRFLRFGVTIPIHVVPLAVDTTMFRPFGAKPKRDKFVFLNYGEQSHRKGTDLLLKAFCEEFGNQPDVELLLVVSNYNRPDLNPNPNVWLKENGVHNARVIMDRPDNDGLVSFINEGDCFVSATREDSFGMCGLESMSCGLPVIAPRNSGYAQYVEHEKNGLLVEGTRVQHQRWEWIPSVDGTKQAMRQMYELWKDDSMALTEYRSNALLTAAKLNWQGFGKQFENIILS